MALVKDIAKAIEAWAPKGSAQSYDNVGLQVGDPDAPVNKVLVALDLTPEVLQEAIDSKCELLVTHHPIIFKGLKSVTSQSYISKLVLDAARNNINIYAGHTNVDASMGGVSFLLAQELGLADVGFLSSLDNAVVKLVTFVPRAELDTVRDALAEAGAGEIGKYDSCSFTTSGKGRFKPGKGSSPQIGSQGNLEEVEEYRLEVQCNSWDLQKTISALKEHHPYEEVAFDVYPTSNESTSFGLGCIGTLEKPTPLIEFLIQTKESLGLKVLRHSVSPESKMVQKIAVCGGSGSSLISAAKKHDADVYITADISYHTYFESFDATGKARLVLVDIGHYESEVYIEQHFVDRFSKQFEEVEWKRTTISTNPMVHL